MAQDQFWVHTEIGRSLSQTDPQFLCTEWLGWVPLSTRGGPTFAHQPVCTPGRLATSLCHFGMEPYGRGPAPAPDRNWKLFLPLGMPCWCLWRFPFLISHRRDLFLYPFFLGQLPVCRNAHVYMCMCVHTCIYSCGGKILTRMTLGVVEALSNLFYWDRVSA